MVAYFPDIEEDLEEAAEDEEEGEYEEWLRQNQTFDSINENYDNEPSIPAAYDGDFSDYSALELSKNEVESLKELHALSKENGCEYAQILYEDKCTEIFTSNEYNCVEVSAWKDKINIDGLTIFHSHTNKTPLSGGDFSQFCDTRVNKIGNIAANGDTYVVEIGDGYRPTKDEFIEVLKEIVAEVDQDIAKMYYEQGLTIGETNYMAIKEQGYRIARAFGWTYMGGRIDE